MSLVQTVSETKSWKCLPRIIPQNSVYLEYILNIFNSTPSALKSRSTLVLLWPSIQNGVPAKSDFYGQPAIKKRKLIRLGDRTDTRPEERSDSV